jgi:hypothetical protein
MIIPIVYISGMIIPIVHISGMIIPIVYISGMIIPIVYISGMIPALVMKWGDSNIEMPDTNDNLTNDTIKRQNY